MTIRELIKGSVKTNLSICKASSEFFFSSHLTHPVFAGSRDPAIYITSSSKLHNDFDSITKNFKSQLCSNEIVNTNSKHSKQTARLSSTVNKYYCNRQEAKRVTFGLEGVTLFQSLAHALYAICSQNNLRHLSE